MPTISERLHDELTRLGGAAVLHALQCAIEAHDQATGDDPSASDGNSRSLAWERAEQFAREAYERSWEKLHCGAWKSVASAWREAYGAACLVLAMCQEHAGELRESVKTLDMKPRVANDDAVQAHERSIRFPVQRLRFPSLAEFRERVLLRDEPVIITGAMDDWPALGRHDPTRAWRNIEYFRRVAGWRTVPIEIGSSYLEDDWKQELMTINEFLDRYIASPASNECSSDDQRKRRVGYLAQHHLFEQIPVLGRDILTPDYCVLRRSSESDEDEDEDEDIAVNAWFGPRGTVSPLHFDPKDNLLCQAVGAKYLRLYAPRESAKLYPVDGLLSNTSQVAVESPDFDAFPAFRDAAYVECVLREGEMLYIPPRHWHFVKSLTTSFSVSFWWS